MGMNPEDWVCAGRSPGRRMMLQPALHASEQLTSIPTPSLIPSPKLPPAGDRSPPGPAAQLPPAGEAQPSSPLTRQLAGMLPPGTPAGAQKIILGDWVVASGARSGGRCCASAGAAGRVPTASARACSLARLISMSWKRQTNSTSV